LNAEGLDLKVLEGANGFIGRTEIILAEAAIAQRDFENRASKLIQVMNGHGYRLFDITDLNRSPHCGLLSL
jgi:hypothetical protein